MRFPDFPERLDPITRWAKTAPDRIALVDRTAGNCLTYAELSAHADRWAGLLRGMGIGSGDRVGLISGARHEVFSLFFACGRVGAALVPYNWRLAPAELAPIIAHSAPRVIVGERRYGALVAEAPAASTVPWLELDSDVGTLLASEPGATRDEIVRADAAALVLYTSGSTGAPKGVVLPHRQIFYNAMATSIAWELGASDVAPVASPLFHTGAWNVFATPLLYRGGRVVILDKFEPAEFMRALAEEKCTVALTVPTQLVMLRECEEWGRPLPALRAFWSGGAALPRSLAESVRAAGYALREGYGLTECGPNCFTISADQSAARPGVVGWPVPFLDARILDEAGADVRDDEAGELCLRGPQMFAGYLDDPVRTAEALTADGWLRTGDLARREPDGAFAICGRRKEMYISGGENVFPGEVEAVLAGCPGVAEAVVLGVPDERWGEVGRAYLVMRPDSRADETDVLVHARSRLAAYKVPKSIVFLKEIPKLASGKPDRRALAGSVTGVLV